ncbi:mammalian cell entry protein [Mycolicibacterium celeriflavum]|uniref:MCE family protein n=1 Tax=Mycolicibacterium celeriflavum TaxID=1249101 RepID=UPI0007FC1451|nr:MCE family protein [Mycolicibacterium celeriflavum]OBG16693.1 mammalian cell entry protein [Mycolicibacterium celeriflavum]
MGDRRVGLKVAIFTVAMLLVLGLLVVTFGQFRFGSDVTYHADFASVSRLKEGQDVRIAGIVVGNVKDIEIRDGHASVTFDVNKRFALYTSTRAVIRYQDLVGNRYLEITAGPGDLRRLPPGATIPQSHTEPALDLDALLGGLRPVLKGLDATKVNEISNAVIELLQGKGGALADILSSTGSFTRNLASRDQLIGDVITDLNEVLSAVDGRSAELDKSVDQLQKLVSALAAGRGPIAGAIEPLASAESDLTDMLTRSRRPIQGVLENTWPLATKLDERKDEINKVIEPLAEDYMRLQSLGAYGSFFNFYYCSVKIKINGPAGSDIIIPAGGPPDPTKGRCAFAE